MIPIWGFVAVALPLVLTPGASTAVVLRNSLEGGTRAGLVTALGANLGSLCFGILCAVGFGVALQRWPGVWLVLRVAGIAYLAFLGVQSVRQALGAARAPAAPRASAPHAAGWSTLDSFREGYLTNVTNPALATFYFVILPQFIPRGAPVARAALQLTLVHIGLALTWHAVWAAAGGTLSHVLASGRPRQFLNLAAGIALLWLAVKLAV